MTTTHRRRAEVGYVPPGVHTRGVAFLIWDMLDSWPDQWFTRREIEAHVADRRTGRGSDPDNIGRALTRLVEAGHIEQAESGETHQGQPINHHYRVRSRWE